MARVITTNSRPAAAALLAKSSPGLETYANIWIGITVKGDINHSNEIYGGWAVMGAGGKKAIKVRAPMVTMGAVSPIARLNASMTPVRMPAAEYGTT